MYSHKSEIYVKERLKAKKALAGIVKIANVEVSGHEDIAAAFGVHVHDEDFP